MMDCGWNSIEILHSQSSLSFDERYRNRISFRPTSQKGATEMAKGQQQKKQVLKKPAKSLIEKRIAKQKKKNAQ